MLNEKQKRDVQSQIDYATSKYGGNRPPSLVRAEAEKIANKAMENYNPSHGGIKTYLSSRLQKMSRAAYKASSPLNIPESRLMGRTKLRNFIDEYKDTHGFSPSVDNIAEGLSISKKEADRMISEYGAVRAESLYAGGKDKAPTLSPEAIIQSLPIKFRNLATDIFINEKKDADIMKEHGLKRSTYQGKKREISSHIKGLSYLSNIERD